MYTQSLLINMIIKPIQPIYMRHGHNSMEPKNYFGLVHLSLSIIIYRRSFRTFFSYKYF